MKSSPAIPRQELIRSLPRPQWSLALSAVEPSPRSVTTSVSSSSTTMPYVPTLLRCPVPTEADLLSLSARRTTSLNTGTSTPPRALFLHPSRNSVPTPRTPSSFSLFPSSRIPLYPPLRAIFLRNPPLCSACPFCFFFWSPR